MTQVIATNDDATTTKVSCTQLGYYDDPALQYFAKNVRRQEPIINRGTYARVCAIRGFTKAFIESGGGKKIQVLTLGAGYDTAFFALKDVPNASKVKWFECDFLQLTMKKAKTIKSEPKLRNLLRNYKAPQPGTIIADNYVLFPTDLRHADKFKTQLAALQFDFSVPTLVVSECVLVYISKQESEKIIQHLATACKCLQFIVYEMIKPNDPFGRQMLKSLNERGCPLQSVPAYPTLESQQVRFKAAGFDQVEAYDMLQVYGTFINGAERTRVEALERLDEMEEWVLISRHYLFLVATKTDANWHPKNLEALRGKLILEKTT